MHGPGSRSVDRAVPRTTSRGPSGRGLLGSRVLHHDSLWKLSNIRRQLQTIRTSRASHASRGSCECTGRTFVPFAGPCRAETHFQGPSGRGLLGSRDLHHDSLWKLFDIRRQLQTIRTSLTPQVEAVRARAGLSCRSPSRAAPNPPPGAAFSVLEIPTTIAFGGN